MKLKVALPLMLIFGAASAYLTAAEPNPYASDNPKVNMYLGYLAKDSNVKALVGDYEAMDKADDIFYEHLEIARIASPSRQEYYRAKALYDRLKAYGFDDQHLVFTGADGTMPGAAVQQVDGLRVYQTCAIIDGSWSGATDGTNDIWSRPKVVIEGHIDTVNPSTIPEFTADMPKTTGKDVPWYFEPVKLQPVWDNRTGLVEVVPTKEALAALPIELAFSKDSLSKVDLSDSNYTYVTTENNRYDRFPDGGPAAATAKQKEAYRIYVPGYSDAIGNTIHVYTLAKLFHKYQDVKNSRVQMKLQPVYDIWFCFTAGEEGRGNLAGMKQLYGYNQQNAAKNPAENGRNTLNIVANLSIDGGTMTYNFLGSYRYEVNYKGVNGALEAARSIAALADVRSPWETDKALPRSTYTVGTAYKKADGSTSYEIDMRSPTPDSLNVMKGLLYPHFGSQTGQVKERNGVQIQELWFGDRPAHETPLSVAETDPLIFAAWQTYMDLLYVPGPNDPPTFQLPEGSSSVNDNIPAAMGIPTVNLNIGTTADGGGGHAFYEWGIRGKAELESRRMQRVLRTLLVLSGLTDTDQINTSSVPLPELPPVYGEKAPRHTNQVWDAQDYWQTH